MQRNDKIKFVSSLVKRYGHEFDPKVRLYEFISSKYYEACGEYWSPEGIRKFIKRYEDQIEFTYSPQPEDKVNGKLQLENARLKSELKKQKALLKSVTANVITSENLASQIREYAPRLPLVSSIPTVNIEKQETDLPTEELILLLSDHHITRTVDAYEMEGYNQYSFDIWACRYFHVIKETISTVEALRKTRNITTLNVYMLGDMFNDTHRPENVSSNDHEPVPGTVSGSYVLAQGIAMLCDYFDNVEFVGIVGNEPRMSQKVTSKYKFNNYDYIGYRMMASYLANYITSGVLYMTIPPSPEVVVDLLGHKILLTHGDTIRGWNGIPYYGVDKQRARQQAIRRERGGFDYWFLGHFHTPTELQGNTYINGALVGADEYAKNILHVSGDPIQKLFVFNENYGVTSMYNINTRDASEHSFSYDFTDPDGNVVNSPLV